jgi:hypothetical protein
MKLGWLAVVAVLLSVGCGATSGAAGTGPASVEVSPAPSLRQGQGSVTVSLARASGGLSRASSFDLGDLAVERDAASTDTHLVLRVSVPHGAALGPRTLTVAGVEGLSSFPQLLEVGPIAVASSGADDGLGTSGAPFRTIKQALLAAGEGDTVQLAAGTYDAAAGETWGYMLPAGLTVAGDSESTTRLDGASAVDGGAPASIGLIARGALVLRDLTLDGFGVDLDVTGPGAITLTATTVRRGAPTGHALQIDAGAAGSRAALDGVTIDGDIAVADAAAGMTIAGSTIRDGSGAAQPCIDFGGADLSVADSTISGVETFGINFRGSTLELSGVTIEGGNYDVYQLSGRSRVRRSKLRDYRFIGYYLAAGELDLGTQTEAGDNELSSAATGPAVFGLYVDDISSPVTCSDTTFNGDVPPAGVRMAGTEPIAVPGEYFINYGKSMSFWTL